MSKLRIAITADTYSHASEVTNLVKAPFAPRGLVEVIAKLGAIPVILPDVQGLKGEDYVELFDGLIIPGGPDVDPTLFGEEPRWKVGGANYKRDVFELELFRAFYEAGKPIFGICRGCQLINIALGGNVYQDLQSEDPQCTIRHSQGADGRYPTHHVTLTPGSSLYDTLGATAYVNSRCFLSSENPHFHHENSPSSSGEFPHFQREHQDAVLTAASCRMSACSMR